MQLITIKKSRIETDLTILKNRLEAEGIACYLKNLYNTQLLNFVPSFVIELQVKAVDVAQAQSIINAIENSYE